MSPTADLYTAACRRVADWRSRYVMDEMGTALVDALLADLQVVVSVAEHDSAALYDKLQAADSDLASATALYGVALKRAELAESEAGLRWRERAEAATAAARELAEALRAVLFCAEMQPGETCAGNPAFGEGECPWWTFRREREPDDCAARARALLAKHAEVIR